MPGPLKARKTNIGSKRDPIYLSASVITEVMRLFRCGCTVDDVCAYLQISKPTFYAIKRRQPEVEEAYLTGKQHLRAFVAEGIYKLAKDSPDPKVKLSALKELAKAHMPELYDRKAPVSVNVNVDGMTDEQLEVAVLAELKGEPAGLLEAPEEDELPEVVIVEDEPG